MTKALVYRINNSCLVYPALHAGSTPPSRRLQGTRPWPVRAGGRTWCDTFPGPTPRAPLPPTLLTAVFFYPKGVRAGKPRVREEQPDRGAAPGGRSEVAAGEGEI